MGEWSYNAPIFSISTRQRWAVSLCPSPLYPQVLLCWRGCPHSLPGHCVERQEKKKGGFFFLNEELNSDSAIFQPVVLSPDKMRHPHSFLSHLPISKCFIFLDNTQKLGSKLLCLKSHKVHQLLLLILEETTKSHTESEPFAYQLYCINVFKQQIHASSM